MSLTIDYSSSGSDDEVSKPRKVSGKLKKTVTGYTEPETMEKSSFYARKRHYEHTEAIARHQKSHEIKRKRHTKGDSSVLDGANAYMGPWADYSGSSTSSSDEDNEPLEYTVAPDPNIHRQKQPDERTEYFGPEGTKLLDSNDTDEHVIPIRCFTPKKGLHTYHAHAGGVQAIHFLPRTGRLLLSCGNDSQIKIWDIHGSRKLLRGYYGHTQAVKDISFNEDGTQFISCSYDKYIKVWDTETGKCVSRRKVTSYPDVVRFNPTSGHEFLVGSADGTVGHFDINTDESIQTYDQHRGAINCIEFIANNERFVTSSADKSVMLWDWRVNMPVQRMGDPKQHAITFLLRHPNEARIAAQSLDNTVIAFGGGKIGGPKFRRISNRKFQGHHTAGYSIGLSFTPDGRTLVSGDSYGYTYFWDWKTTKLVTRIKVDDKVISSVECHPLEKSLVAMAGISGNIYLYD